jgi:mRNA-degrading endonuclease RelE of RelBE toxin-antitoxin system
MVHIRWSATAFAALESLPQKTTFDILDRADKLGAFHELGGSLRQLYPRLGNCRQMVFKRRYRLVYVYDSDESEIKILMLQHCRQQLPTNADLHRAIKEIEMADEEGRS